MCCSGEGGGVGGDGDLQEMDGDGGDDGDGDVHEMGDDGDDDGDGDGDVQERAKVKAGRETAGEK